MMHQPGPEVEFNGCEQRTAKGPRTGQRATRALALPEPGPAVLQGLLPPLLALPLSLLLLVVPAARDEVPCTLLLLLLPGVAAPAP